MGADVQLSRIQIFPIKSLDPVEVREAAITAGGIIENDRVYSIVDLEGRIVNGKRTTQIHGLRSVFDPAINEVALWAWGDSSPTRFVLHERAPIDRWLSDFFGFAVCLRYEPVNGFPDDTTAFGPTITGTASLLRVQEWYASLTLENVRRRFRANLELDGFDAFGEDRLFGAPGELRPFRIGPVQFLGHNPCQRCAVPSRDPDTGDPIHGFQKRFMELRERHLPVWGDRRRFDHFYRLAVNTSVLPSEVGKCLRVGDIVVL